MTQAPLASLTERCCRHYWHRNFSELTLDHPVRMAAVFALLLAEVEPGALLDELQSAIDATLHTYFTPMATDVKRECCPVEQQKRQDFLDALYEQSGRRERGDYTYTGLYIEHLKAEAARLNPEPAA